MGAKYEIVTLTTPQKNLLFGLWSTPAKPQKVIIYVHGLSSSAFSLEKVCSQLYDSKTAILKFNNRGHDIISKLNKVDKRKKKGYKMAKIAGAAHEIFTECTDDIQGAVSFVKEKGIKNIFLVGHSTGCQKSIYYLARRGKQNQIRGVILLCPISDYSAARHLTDPNVLKKAQNEAKKMFKSSKIHDLLPEALWEETIDAQRFLSLYTTDSDEEIFTYANPSKLPKTFQKVNIPMLIGFAGSDEYNDRPTLKIAEWFKVHSKSKNLVAKIIEGASHNFQGQEEKLAKEIQAWLETNVIL